MLESCHFVSDVTHAEVSAARRDWVEIASSGAALSAYCSRRDDLVPSGLNVPEKEFQAARQLTMCGYRPGRDDRIAELVTKEGMALGPKIIGWFWSRRYLAC